MGKELARARRHGLRSILALALTSVSHLALSAPAHAQIAPSEAAATIEYDIPAQDLSAALIAFAARSEMQILFSQADVEGLRSSSVRGRFTPKDALAEIVAGSGLRARADVDGVIRIERARPQSAASDEDASVADDLIVTGTRIRGEGPIGANVIILDRAAIEDTGRSSVQDVVQTLPQNFAGSQNEATQEGTLNARSNFTFGSTVDLRGLGADATLTLVNGRRLAPAGAGNFVDKVFVAIDPAEGKIKSLGLADNL